MEKVTFKGIVKEVRTFKNTVYLFIKCSSPQKVKGKTVKFALNENNCDESFLTLAAGINRGATAIIEKDPHCEHKYSYVDALGDAVSADII